MPNKKRNPDNQPEKIDPVLPGDKPTWKERLGLSKPEAHNRNVPTPQGRRSRPRSAPPPPHNRRTEIIEPDKLEKIDVAPPLEERFPRMSAPPEPPPPPPATDGAPPPKRNRGGSAWFTNIITGLIILLTVGSVGGFVLATRYPYHPLNPLALPTPLPLIITATFLPPTSTPPATATQPAAAQPAPSTEPTLGLPVGMATDPPPTVLGGGPPATLSDGFPFRALADAQYIENENERGCNWSSVAGTVYNLEGTPVGGVRVRLRNVETDEPITVFTGSSARYPDGYEYVVSNMPTSQAFMVGLVGAGGVSLSEEVMVVTSERCTQNVLVLDFEQIGPYNGG